MKWHINKSKNLMMSLWKKKNKSITFLQNLPVINLPNFNIIITEIKSQILSTDLRISINHSKISSKRIAQEILLTVIKCLFRSNQNHITNQQEAKFPNTTIL